MTSAEVAAAPSATPLQASTRLAWSGTIYGVQGTSPSRLERDHLVAPVSTLSRRDLVAAPGEAASCGDLEPNPYT